VEFICDAPGGKAWFRMETEAEATQESAAMNHAVEKYFRREREKALQSYKPTSQNYIERDIGLNAHIARAMPLFLTLRSREGHALATAMLPPQAKDDPSFRIIIVGPANADPYAEQGEAITALAAHTGLTLDREGCFPYGRLLGG
jgi:hypothetical protein